MGSKDPKYSDGDLTQAAAEARRCLEEMNGRASPHAATEEVMLPIEWAINELIGLRLKIDDNQPLMEPRLANPALPQRRGVMRAMCPNCACIAEYVAGHTRGPYADRISCPSKLCAKTNYIIVLNRDTKMGD